MGARESVRDVARNLERFVDAIVARTGPHAVVVELAAQASIPVINGLTLREHPCQALADMFTMRERFGRLEGVVLAFVGDGNNVYHSLALLGAALGMEVRLAHPPGYAPNPAIVERARQLAATGGGRLDFGHPTRGGRSRRGRRLHRRLDVDGPGGGDGGTARRVRALPRRRGAARDRRSGHRRDALPAGASRRGDHVRSHGRPAEHHLGPVGEPAPLSRRPCSSRCSVS